MYKRTEKCTRSAWSSEDSAEGYRNRRDRATSHTRHPAPTVESRGRHLLLRWRLSPWSLADVPGEHKVDDVVGACVKIVQVSCRCVVGDKQVAGVWRIR